VSMMRPLRLVQDELAAEKRKVKRANSETEAQKRVHAELLQQAEALEEEKEEIRRESDQWQTRTLELEYECATLALGGTAARSKFQQVEHRERALLDKFLGSEIACIVAENSEMRALSRAQDRAIDLDHARLAIASSADDVDMLRKDLQDARSEGAAARSAFRRLLNEYELLQADHALNTDALSEEVERTARLASRNESLESELMDAAAAATMAMKKALPLVEAPSATPRGTLLVDPSVDDAVSVPARPGPLTVVPVPELRSVVPLRSFRLIDRCLLQQHGEPAVALSHIAQVLPAELTGASFTRHGDERAGARITRFQQPIRISILEGRCAL